MPNMILKRYLLLHVFVLVSMYDCVSCKMFIYLCSVFILPESDNFPICRIHKFHHLHHRSYARGIQPIEIAMTLSQVSCFELNEIINYCIALHTGALLESAPVTAGTNEISIVAGNASSSIQNLSSVVHTENSTV